VAAFEFLGFMVRRGSFCILRVHGTPWQLLYS